MSGDNPFSEPDDADRTVIRPAPGGRRAAPVAPAPPSPATPAPAPAAAEIGGEEAVIAPGGQAPLLDAATPLLQLLARLRNTAAAPEPGDLRERAVVAMRGFEQRARAADVATELLRPAHYALCASLDDAVLNTPWGSQGGWAARSLVSSFHQEVQSGERFFEMLGQMRQHPGRFLPVLELMYLCLSLGFMGRYRLSPRGPAELDALREELHALIRRQRPSPEPALSPQWQGVSAPYRPARAVLPLWVLGSAALALLGGLFVLFSASLNAGSDALYEAMQAAPLASMPAIARAAAVAPPPPPAEPGALERLRGFLKPEIDQGLVSVRGTPAAPMIRIRNRGLFASGSAVVQPGFLGLLRRIGGALQHEHGQVQVIGYTDNQPIHTVKFPSNFALSTARAEAARAVIGQAIGDPARLAAEGRGDADPVASNATAAGREENRRIEVLLQRESAAP
jgi:type VI secretion system protein ImpK